MEDITSHRSPARGPGQRAGLTRARVLAAARELVAEQGLEALTMRSLARRLDVAPNALYSHVASKTALIDAVLDEVLDEVEAPAPDSVDPGAGLRALMTSTHEVLLSHPDLLPAYVARHGARGPNAQRLGEIMMTLLARGGIEEGSARGALQVLIVHVIGSAAFADGVPWMTGDGLEPPEGGSEVAFDDGLRWLLVGIGVPP